MSFLFQNTLQSELDGVPMQQSESEKHQDLLIFGYNCKLFRDDRRASAIDAGEHLIPWMGDSSLKIDRYDGRGHLFDLTPYDADNTENRSELSAEEKRIERLCEEERYLELHTDLAEKAIQEEEEIKRLNMELAESNGYQAVGFSYDNPTGSSSRNDAPINAGDDTQKDEEEDDRDFIPPPELCLPVSMQYPTGTKLNALIEKTAKFVSSQGGQMEIMIKTKQANNPQFKFLNFEHNLNPYYKHQVHMIKSGRYNPEVHNKPPPAPPKPGVSEAEESDDDADYSGYLHPSLLAKSTASQPVSSALPTHHYTQSQLENTSYGRLLKKMSDNLPSLTNSPQRTITPTPSDVDSNSQSAFPEQILKLAVDEDPAQVAADGDSALSTGDVTNHADAAAGGYSAAACTEGDVYGDMDGYAYDSAYYAHYYQNYYHNPPAPPPPGTRPSSPPPELKPLIERLINYVKKDGEAFEKQVLLKNDDRFSFLQPGDPHYSYYNWRKQSVMAERASLAASESLKSKGVSFSIKQKEPEAATIDTSRVALPIDPESDEDDINNREAANNAADQAAFTTQQYLALPPAQPELPRRVDEKPLSDESLQKKLAEQKLRDKLAAAAREKMTQVTQNTKDKSLQAERKRKASMFVNMLKIKQKAPPIGPELPPPEQPAADAAMYSESRLSADSENDYREYSPYEQHAAVAAPPRSRSRSPPSAYTVRVNRSRDSHRRDSRALRHARHPPDERPNTQRRRRSPSPLKHRRKHRRSPNAQLPPPLPPSQRPTLPPPRVKAVTQSMDYYSVRSGTSSPQSTGDPDRPTSSEDNEFMSKVRKMLRESRQAMLKEDLLGN